MRIDTLNFIIGAFVSASVGVAAVLRNWRSRLHISFGFLCAVLLSHDVTGLVLEVLDSPSLNRLHILATLAIGPAMFWFLGEFLTLKHFRRILGFYVLVGLVLLLMMSFKTSAPFLGPISLCTHLLMLLPAFGWVYYLQLAEKAAQFPRERLRIRNLSWGALIVIAFYFTDVTHWAFGGSIAPVGTIIRSLFLFFCFQTIVQREFLSAEEVATKVALFTSLSLILSGIYLLMVAWVGNQPGLFFLNTLTASFVVIVLFDPIRKFTARLVRRLFLRRHLIIEAGLESLSHELLGMVEPQEISRRIFKFLKKSLGVEKSVMFVQESDGITFTRLEAESNGRDLSASNVLLEYMILRRGRPFIRETIESDRESFYSLQHRRFCESCLDTMRELGCDFVIPFVYESRVVGFCAVTAGERIVLSNEQMRLFIPVSRQVALQLKNAQTFKHLRDQDKLVAMGELAAGLAHEIKNPLGAIRGAAELLQSNPHGEEVREYASVVVQEADRLSRVVTDFLNYAKPRKSNLADACEPMQVVEHTLSLIKGDAKVRIQINNETKGAKVAADPEALKQVLLNLSLNAIQAMGNDPTGVLTITLREIRPKTLFNLADSLPLFKVWEGWRSLGEKHKPYLELEVADNGPGIPEEDRARIFLPFYTTKLTGSGLGLAICQRLVESMDGTITVRPNLGKGTLFKVHLPLVPARENSLLIQVARLTGLESNA